jgi:regulatory protein
VRRLRSSKDVGPLDAAADDPKKVEAAAVRLLARREHSTGELRRKLLNRGHAAAAVDPIIEKLSGKRLVSDDRYVAGFVHHHARRGQGPIRIRAELRQQGIADDRIAQELQTCGADWRHLAAEVRRRKFGAALPRGPAERAKQARFLQYRGFDADQIRAALSFDPDTDADDPGADTQLTDEAADPDSPEDPGST